VGGLTVGEVGRVTGTTVPTRSRLEHTGPLSDVLFSPAMIEKGRPCVGKGGPVSTSWSRGNPSEAENDPQNPVDLVHRHPCDHTVAAAEAVSRDRPDLLGHNRIRLGQSPFRGSG
jgi:hypothetical protein